ncbi:MAG: SDR family oxidoreductase [Chloroflexi bacterium]|nr:SDR family oxidoreductase [Chloroflexota bacterium]
MSDSVVGRVVLITGAGSGIGEALARRFRADGALVAGCDLPRRLGVASTACDLAMAANVTVPAEIGAFAARAEQRFGRIDALIANAGTGRISAIEDGAWNDIELVIRVNLFGVLHSIRAVLPAMRRQSYGRLVAVVSRHAEICPPQLAPYSASKAAVITATRTLANELRGSDILVNNLIPGPTKTALNPRGLLAPDASYATAKMLALLPTGGPSGRTFFEERDYPVFSRFSSGETAALL